LAFLKRPSINRVQIGISLGFSSLIKGLLEPEWLIKIGHFGLDDLRADLILVRWGSLVRTSGAD
jgi:hypothetical protein